MARRVPQLLAHSCLTEEDNFQNGILGLFTAIQRFDALQGYSFLTYAAYWIRQSILREAINTGLTVRIPVHYFDTLCRVRVVCTTCMQLDGRISGMPLPKLKPAAVTPAQWSRRATT